MFENNIEILAIIIVIIIVYYWFFYDKNQEHYATGTSAVLSNEAIQTMGSVLNSGNGTITNLNITGKLTVGKTVINTDGSIKIGDTLIDANGNITWPTGKSSWKMGRDGDLFVLRNMTPANGPDGKPLDVRYAFYGDGRAEIGKNIITTGGITASGNISTSGNISASNMTTSDTVTIGNWKLYSRTNPGLGVPVGFNWSGKNDDIAGYGIFRIDAPESHKAKFEIDSTGLFGSPSSWGNKGFF